MKCLHAHAFGLITLLPILLLSGFGVLVPPSAQAAQTFESTRGGTLITSSKMDLTRAGQTIGFITVPSGTRVILVSESADGYMVARSKGEAPFAISKESLSLDPVSLATATATPTPTPVPTPVVGSASTAGFFVPATPTAPTTAPMTPATATLGAKNPTSEEVNKALGIPLFGNGSLWDENDAVVAGRQDWPTESRTSFETGYRWYPYSDNSATTVLGARALSLFLQGINNKVARVSVLFANKGDVAFYSSAKEAKQQATHSNEPLNVTDAMLKGCQDAMRHDKVTVEASLKALFGESKPARKGRFASTTESGERWDWNGHTFLLVAPLNEYVSLRILPTATFEDADAGRKSFALAKSTISQRVKRKENGDIVITDLPMVDQGHKGYCVPATFERVLRYYGLSEDMNILATAGKTAAGGGTSVEAIQSATYNLLRDAGANVSQKTFSGSIQEIKPIIDAGKPILFTHYSTEEFNNRVNDRMAHRVAVANMEEWKNNFLPSLKKTIPLKPDPMYGHICLIIGYNEKTREIAISDSWGRAAKERWMTEEEARQIKQTSGITVIE